jgi:2-haloacid dehalogenase
MNRVIAFDMVGTLLDLSALDSIFAQTMGNASLRKEWFSEVLKLALVTTTVSAYSEFSKITQAALKVIEERHKLSLAEADRMEILQTLRKLPPFPDVKPGLQQLRQQGWRMVVLTNTPANSAEQQLEHAGIRDYFERVFSADSVQRLKPAPEPYRMAARELGIGISSLVLVAAHSWDIHGSIWAGCHACFLRRPEQVLDEIAPRPLLIASDMHEFAAGLKRLAQAA